MQITPKFYEKRADSEDNTVALILQCFTNQAH